MKHLKNNKGQTLTEFLFVVVLLVFLVLAHTQLSLSYVFANVIHYATFMAALCMAVWLARNGHENASKERIQIGLLTYSGIFGGGASMYY